MYLPRRANRIYPSPLRSATQIRHSLMKNCRNASRVQTASARVGHRIKTRVLQRRFTTTDKRAAASSSHLQKAQGEELLTPAALVKCGRRSYVPRDQVGGGGSFSTTILPLAKRFQQAHSDCYLFLEAGKPITIAICVPAPYKV